MPLRSIDWKDGSVIIIDQTRLPHKLVYEKLSSVEEVGEAIKEMRVRGAPLIGVASALGLALFAEKNPSLGREEFLEGLKEAARYLRGTRPTAVNLQWALDRVLSEAERSGDPVKAVVETALQMMEEDVEVNRRMASQGQSLVEDGDRILTHCNTGSLATVSLGTALGVVVTAHQRGKRVKVYATETRPRMQGARLTMFELLYEGLDATLIPDTAVGYVMKKGLVDKVMVGADRILRDGTTYNKIGTLQIAVLAERYGIPFYVVAPTSTIDPTSRREDIIIEERPWEEVTHIQGIRIPPEGVKILNPAFDETPPELITAIITEKAILKKPYTKNIKPLFTQSPNPNP